MSHLKRLNDAATQGVLVLADWTRDDGPNKLTLTGHKPEALAEGQRNIWPNGVQSIRVADFHEGNTPEADAAFIVELVNAYREGRLVEKTDSTKEGGDV